MFNPNASTKSLGSCVYLVEELCLDATLAGVVFTGELQIEIDRDGDWYLECVTATNAKGRTQVYGEGHPIYGAISFVIFSDHRLNELITEACIEHAE